MQSFEWFRNIPAVIIPNLQLNKSVYSESHSASVLSASQVDCLDIFPTHLTSRAIIIAGDPSTLFSLLPSGRRYRGLHAPPQDLQTALYTSSPIYTKTLVPRSHYCLICNHMN